MSRPGRWTSWSATPGAGDQGLFDRVDWSRTRQMLQTNVIAVAQLTAALVPSMVGRGRGGVLNMGSGAGLTVLPAAAAYCASKHFVDGFSAARRADLAGTGVVVTQVGPGPADSEFDTVAGTAGGMTGGPPQFLRISAAQCAREALAGFGRGAALVFPGRAYRIAMGLLPLLPRGLQAFGCARRTRAADLRRGWLGADPDEDRPDLGILRAHEPVARQSPLATVPGRSAGRACQSGVSRDG